MWERWLTQVDLGITKISVDEFSCVVFLDNDDQLYFTAYPVLIFKVWFGTLESTFQHVMWQGWSWDTQLKISVQVSQGQKWEPGLKTS